MKMKLKCKLLYRIRSALAVFTCYRYRKCRDESYLLS